MFGDLQTIYYSFTTAKSISVKKKEAFVTLLVNEVDFMTGDGFNYGDAAKVN